jgi:predicted amidohydrolase
MLIRCLENRVFAVTCNRTGRDERKGGETLAYTGGSQVVDPRGGLLVRAGEENPEGQVVEIRPERSRNKEFNEFNHIFGDRRVEVYDMINRSAVP